MLLITLVMIISIGAISAADTNATLLEEVSDTDIATVSFAVEQKDNATSLGSGAGNDVEQINVNNNLDEIFSHEVESASSNSKEILSASNDDLLKSGGNNFYYDGTWYEDLDDAVDEACDNNGGTIRIWGGTYGSDSDDVKITISDGVHLTFEPYGSSHTVIFDGSKNDNWFFEISDKNAHVTFNRITFRNGGAFQGGAIEVDEGQLNVNDCIFESNKAFQNLAGGYGWGGAIYLDDDECSLVARNCRFINNNAASGGGAVCVEGDGSNADFYNCYFEGNKQGDENNDVYDKDSGSHSFSNCDFIGQGSIDFTVNYVDQSVEITPEVDDEVNYLVLYHYGAYYDSVDCNSGSTKTFRNLELGSYTIYMKYNDEKRYIYKDASFRIVANDFILNDNQPFKSLSEAVNAISDGGTGVITVKSGIYTERENFNVKIQNNKKVTIKAQEGSLEPVIFSSKSSSTDKLLDIYAGCNLTMEGITITGKFYSAISFWQHSYGTFSNCKFEHISENPLNVQYSNVVLNDCTFESNEFIYAHESTLTVNDCTFTNNTAQHTGGAIYGYDSTLIITGSKFIGNVAPRIGGAIAAKNLIVSDTEFIGNSAENGGAIFLYKNDNGFINITDCVFDSNIATENYRNIYFISPTREANFEHNEFDLNLKITPKDGIYGQEYILEGDFDWGCNYNNPYTVLAGIADDEIVFGDLVTIEDNKFKINMGVPSAGTHELYMPGMYSQGDRMDHFFGHDYFSDLYGNEFYLNDAGYAKILIDKAKITLTLEVKDVLIPETPVLNVYANWDLNYTVFVQNKYYQLEVVKGKASMQLTGLDLGNYTVVAMRNADENFELAMNFTSFSISKTYSNFLVLSTNAEYDTLNEAVANSNSDDTIFIKNGTYKNTGIVISNKTLDIFAMGEVVFDAQGGDANFIIVSENAAVDIWGITFSGLHNRNTNYGAIVNHGYLSLYSCNFTDNKITKTSFAQNGGAAIFSDGYLLEINYCNFVNNVAPLKVGTAAVTSLGHEDVSIRDSKFINNSAREGGALHFKNLVQYDDAISDCNFEQNTAVKGSAIYVGNNSRYLSVVSSSFKKNDIKNNFGEKAQLEGGVIYVNANTTEVVLDIGQSNFENNSNSKVDGGVICLDGVSKAYIEDSIFNNNKGNVGSVILIKNPYNKKLTLFVDGSNFINNNATIGAIATSPKVTTFIDECLFENNTGVNGHIHSNGFTVAHDSVFDVRDAKLNALSVLYGEKSIINGTVDFGTNLYAAANLTVAGENVILDIVNNEFTYKTDILNRGKYSAVLNSIGDGNNNTYLMDGITEIFRVNRNSMEFNVSVDNITYGETLKVVERLPSNAMGALVYQLSGKYYTKEEIESLKLDAGKYTLVATYDHEDYVLSAVTVNFEVYKANPTISVADVEVGYNDSIIVNIETNVPSTYTIEIGDYKTVKFINGSRSVEIENTFEPGTYTIKVTSQERVNYISNSTEATLKVNKNLPLFALSVSNEAADSDDAVIKVSSPVNAEGNMKYTVSDSNKNVVYTLTQSCRDDLVISGLDDGTYEIDAVFEGDNRYYSTNNIQKTSLSIMKSSANLDNEIRASTEDNNNLGEEDYEGRFIYQHDEDDDYSYFDTLKDAVDEAVLYGAGIITVRGGTYSVSSMDIEGEVELTIRAYGDEKVIFDCGGNDYFMLLTYDEEVEWVTTPPPPHPETEQTDGPTVTLENITVMNGVATYGGAIDLETGTLTLMNCNFYNNHATNQGGAIYIGKYDSENDAMVIAVNTTFINNDAESEGGAIYIAADNLDGQETSASFYLCTFLENYQGEGDERVRNYFAGGNVDKITSKYCVFNGNGQIDDFAIDKINQTVHVKGKSVDSFDSVVLLYLDQVPLYTIYNNGSRDFDVTFEEVMGGNYTVGVMNDHDFNTYIFDIKFEMKVPNFIISENEVYENLTDAIDAVAENGVIFANVNYFDEDNMEIDIRKSFTLKNFKDDGVMFDGSSAKWFFTIAEGCTVVFNGISFTEGAMKNHATIENYGTLIITNCSFEGFETGVIIYNSGLLNILNSTFSLNFIDNAVVWNEKDLVIDTVEFSDNIVNVSSVVYSNGAAEIISSNFTDNYNSGNGGAIYNKNSLSIKGTVFTENEGYNGGTVYNEGTLEVINSTFEDNTANGYGGTIFNGNELHIFNSTFTGGSSEFDGGAIYNNNIMTVFNSTFVGNSANGKGGAIYNNKSLELTKSIFGINFAEEFANIFNAGNIQYSENIFDFYDVILIIPDGEYGIPTTITGTLDPQFNMDLQLTLPGFVNGVDASVTISDGVFEYTTAILPKGIYDVILNEVIYDRYGNIYYGEAIFDRLIVHKANVHINVTVDDIVLRNSDHGRPILTISASRGGLFYLLFNNRITNVTLPSDGKLTVSLADVGEGNYSVMVAFEGDENYNGAVNTTTFSVTQYEGNFIVNSTGGQFDTLREAIENSAAEDTIYVREGTYSARSNAELKISDKKLSIIALGDVVFNVWHAQCFFDVGENADVTICDVVVRDFLVWRSSGIIHNEGNLTVDGCIFTNIDDGDSGYIGSIIYNEGNLNIVGSQFYDNSLVYSRIITSVGIYSNLIINESIFENNAVRTFIQLSRANSAKIISSVFTENRASNNFILVVYSKDVLISSAFYNNTQDGGSFIDAAYNKYSALDPFPNIHNLRSDNSIFIGNAADYIIQSTNYHNTISGCIFTDNTVKNVVLSSSDKSLSVLESTFSDNTISENGALNIASGNAIVNGSIFTNNKANNYRNIYNDSSNVNITNSVFDALNVDFTVHDIDYGQNEKIEGTIDTGTNCKFTVYLDINGKSYPVNVTGDEFTCNAGILNGGDYTVTLNAKDNNSNTFVFDKVTKIFTVSRVDPGLNVSIDDITQGEKLKVNSTIAKNAKGNVVYELNGKVYSKDQLENLTLNSGNYLVTAIYRGDKNYLPVSEMVNVKVNKVAPNITVNDVAVNYGDEIKINVTVDVADYYTVFLDNRYNESVSLYVENSTIFTFSSVNFNPGSYDITVYVFGSDNYAEAYVNATLTVNKAAGVFNLSSDIIDYGENATINASVPVNAYGNITYRIYDENGKLVYNITQSCLEDLIVPNLSAGRYNVTGTFEGDSYYTNESIINSGVIFVREIVDVNISVSNITYGENAIVTVKSNVDGEYLVYVGTEPILVTVVNGTGNVSVSNLNVGSYIVNVTVVDGNYSGFNENSFDVDPKPVSVVVSVDDIVYGEDAVVLVYGEIDGEYIVEINNQNYTVNVVDGKGNTTINNLGLNYDILVSVTIADGNYSAYNTTTFNVVKQGTPISLEVLTGENNVSMTVNVNDTATGLVKFQVTGTEEYTLYVDVIDGKAVLEDILEIGDYTVIATYMGDSRFSTNITYQDFTIRGHIKKNTTIDARADVNGYRVTLTVNVDENATGFVKLTVGDTVANIELADGVATLTTTLMPNSYYMDVTYLGDDNYNVNSTVVTFTVAEISKENTTIGLNISVGETSAVFDVDLNESVTGLVKFYIVAKESGETSTMYVDVKDGKAELLVNGMESGNYTVTATYMGDSVFNTNATSGDFKIIGHVLKDTPIAATVQTNGNRVLLTVNVDENATGFVEVKSGDSISNIALENGEATLAITLPYGSYSLVITYLGDENYNKNSTKCEFTLIEPAKENTAISLDIDTEENNVTITATVNENATGLVKFQVTGEEEYTLYADVIDGEAVLEDILLTGDYTVIATYMGDSRFNTNITYEDFTIRGHIKKDTPINAGAIVNGNRVTLTVSVDKNATGFVKLSISGGVTYIDVIDGVASLTTTLTPNSYFVDVTYLGDDNYNPNATKLTFTVMDAVKQNTPISLDVDTSENNAEFIVNVNETATGLIKFYIVSKESGETSTMYVDVKDGKAELSVNGMESGNYTVTATYLGDSVFNTNTITKDFEIIGHVLKDTPIAATVQNNGNRVLLTVNVDENATGFVEVKSGDSISNIALENGEATLAITLPYGSYSLVITYLGDENYNENSTKCEFTLVEPDKENTPISLDIVTDETYVGMTVTVNENATGLVKFQVTGEEEYVVYSDVINGKAILEDILEIGDYNVIATYMGDDRFNTNITYGVFTIAGHIKKDTPITAKTDVIGNRVTLTVKVDENATGFVKLAIGDTVANIEVVDGVATLTTTLMPNSYFVDVTYLGDDDFNMNKTKVTFTVTEVSKKNTNIDLNIIAYEDAALIVVDLNETATGLVKFYMVCKETGENYTMYMDVVDGHVETFTNSIVPGNYTVVATYMGDSVFNTNTTSEDVEIIGHVMKDTPITANVETSANRVLLTVNVDENATGFVRVTVGDTVANIELENGEGILTTVLPYGSYSLVITYLGDENYNENSTKCEFTLVGPEKENTPISLDIVTDETYVGMTVTVNENATGLVKFQVTGEEEYVVYSDVINGKAILEDILEIGDYNVIATYMGDDRFNTNITYGDFTIRGHIKKDTPITAYADVNGNRVTLTVSVDENATGFVKLTVSGTIVDLELEDGVATLTTTLMPNSYFVDVTYLGDENFNANATKLAFTVVDVAKENTTISLDVDVISNEKIVTFTVEVDSKATGIVKLEVTGDEEYSLYVDVIEGKAVFEDLLEDGNYTVIATYLGDSIFNTNVTSFDFTITSPPKPDVNITIPDINPGESSVVDVDLPSDATGTVYVLIDGKKVSSAPVTNGSAKVTVPELTAGIHIVEVEYSGDTKYASISKISSVIVSKVDVPANSTSIKITLAVGSKSPKFSITLPDDAKGYVVISIKGVDYFAAVENGTAIVSVPSLAYGSYNVNVIYSGDDKYNFLMDNVIAKIPKPKLTAKNIRIGYTNAYKYKVRVTIAGKAVVKQYVTFKFNGKTYKRLTNSKGYATLKLPKVKPMKTKYTITMAYKDIKLSKKIKVNSIIVAKNLKVKKSAKYLKIKVKLKTVAKKVQKGKQITLKFAGKNYKAKTNKKAVATFTIKKNVLKKLKVGKKYIYKVAYSKDVVNKKITVKK